MVDSSRRSRGLTGTAPGQLEAAAEASVETARPRALGRVLRAQARAVLGLGAAMAALGLMAAPAWAHDQLISSSPVADEELEESPDEIRLEFSGSGLTTGEGVTNELRVLDDSGADHSGETSVDGSTMSAPVNEPLDDGEYEVEYRVVYADGHAEESSIPFSLAADDGGPQGAAGQSGNEAAGIGAAAGSADEDGSESGGTTAEEVEEPENRTEPSSALLPVVFGVGGLCVVVLGVVLVRQKIRQAESWKHGSQDPSADPDGHGGRGNGRGSGEAGGPDGGGPDSGGPGSGDPGRGDSGSGPDTR